MSHRSRSQDAASPALGIMLMLAITLILAVLVLLLFRLPYLYDPSVPAIFKITNVKHDQNGVRNFDSYVVVMNTGTTGYMNKNLYAKTYRNGVELNCQIPTLNGEAFIDGSRHYGVQHLLSRGLTWYPAFSIGIDYTDGTFRPGDVITFEVYDNSTKQIISRHTYTA